MESFALPFRGARRDSSVRREVERRLAAAGVHLDGVRPFDMHVHDERTFTALLRGSLDFGESYMQGWWSCGALDQRAARLFQAKLTDDPPGLELVARAA